MATFSSMGIRMCDPKGYFLQLEKYRVVYDRTLRSQVTYISDKWRSNYIYLCMYIYIWIGAPTPCNITVCYMLVHRPVYTCTFLWISIATQIKKKKNIYCDSELKCRRLILVHEVTRAIVAVLKKNTPILTINDDCKQSKLKIVYCWNQDKSLVQNICHKWSFQFFIIN